MLFLLSPAKSLDYESPLAPLPHTQPRFVEQSQQLIEVLRRQSPQAIAELMSLSDKLAALNAARYAITHRLSTPMQLEGFDLEGYAFDKAASGPDRMVFRRRIES